MMKKQYIAPCADVMLLVPGESIASSGWNQKKTWQMDGFFWSSQEVGTTDPPPASGPSYWWDFSTEELDP